MIAFFYQILIVILKKLNKIKGKMRIEEYF